MIFTNCIQECDLLQIIIFNFKEYFYIIHLHCWSFRCFVRKFKIKMKDNFLYKYLQTKSLYFFLRYVENNKSIRDNTFSLQCEGLNSSFREPFEHIIFILFFIIINAFFDYLNYNIIINILETIHWIFNLLSKLSFLIFFFFQQVSNGNAIIFEMLR